MIGGDRIRIECMIVDFVIDIFRRDCFVFQGTKADIFGLIGSIAEVIEFDRSNSDNYKK
jgi:hypothetical protein